MKKSFITSLLWYSIIHGVVDLCCMIVIFSTLRLNWWDTNTIFITFVIYNVIAFWLQAPFWVFIDKYQLAKESAWVWCLLILLSFFILDILQFVIIFAWIWNALFHIWWWSISLNYDTKKAAYPWVFVAPWSIGLFIWVLIWKSSFITLWPFEIILVFSILFIIFSKIPLIKEYKKPEKAKIKYFEWIILLVLISVSIRSLYWLTAVFPWKADISLLYSLTFAVFLWKTAWWFIADKFWWFKTAFFSLLISAPLLAFFGNYPILAIIWTFLFQMTMPITVSIISNMLPWRSATAFWLTVFALIIWAIPVFFWFKLFFETQIITFIIILISASCLLISFKLIYKFFRNKLNINL